MVKKSATQSRKSRKPSADEDMLAVDLGPPMPRPPIAESRDERRSSRQASFERDFSQLVVKRHLRESLDVTGSDIVDFEWLNQNVGYAVSLYSAVFSKSEMRSFTLPRLFYSPIPRPVLEVWADARGAVSDSGSNRGAVVLVPFPGFQVYREPVSRKTVSVGRCSGLAFFARDDDMSDALWSEDDAVGAPRVLANSDDPDFPTRWVIQSIPGLVFSLDRYYSSVGDL